MKSCCALTFPRSLIVLLALLGICLGCAPAFEEQFPEKYKTYLSEPEDKAIAFVQGGDGGYAYGFSFGKPTSPAAIEGALEQCSVRRQLYEVKGECEIYMVNDRKVEN